MTLLIMVYAAVIATVVWYKSPNAGRYRVSTLCFLYWGAAIMWFVDALVEYAEVGVEYFYPETEAMINDAFLGFSAVALGLIIWLVMLFVKDPEGRYRRGTRGH